MRFWPQAAYVPPTKLVSDYNDSEKLHFRETFQPRAKQYRYFKYCFYSLLIIAFVSLFFSQNNYRLVLFFGLIGIYALLYYVIKPLCPACKRDVDVRVRTFCPECGSSKIDLGGFMRSIECLSCGAILRQGRNGRQYRVRCCTHCGVFLDDKGI